MIEHSWVVESLLDSVYQREVTCLGDYSGARAVVDLAEKWDFHHVVNLVRFHFLNDECEQLSAKRLTLAMALNEKGAAIGYIKTFHAGVWGPLVSDRTRNKKPFAKSGNLYLHGSPVAQLLGWNAIPKSSIFDIGSWSYKSYLELSPTTTWAILRARHLATTVPSEVDGEKFQAEFATRSCWISSCL